MEINEKYVLDTAKELFSIDSPTGYEKNAIDYIKNKVQEMGYSTSRSQKGNLYVEVPGQDDQHTLAFSAHVDTLGLMVRSITEQGNLKFMKVGGPILSTYDGEYCRIITRDHKIYTGTILCEQRAVHVHPEANSASREESTMEVRIDEVVHSKQDVLDLGIQNGDYIVVDPKFTITESGFIKSRFLDDKISACAMLGVLKQFKEENITPKRHLTFIFGCYEEVGHGASYLPDHIEEIIAVDMGCIGLDLSCTEQDVSICAKDSSGPYDYEMTSRLIDLAKKHHLNYAVDLYPQYGSDVSAAYRGGNNIRGALIGSGVDASHGMERTHINGVKNTMKLIMAYATTY